MIWKDLGVVWTPNTQSKVGISHAMGPTPIQLNEDVVRVYVTCLDSKGVGRPTFVDLSSRDITEVIYVNEEPLLDIGKPGAFDDNGLMVTSIVRLNEMDFLMYYAGFELCEKVRYIILTGVAISAYGG